MSTLLDLYMYLSRVAMEMISQNFEHAFNGKIPRDASILHSQCLFLLCLMRARPPQRLRLELGWCQHCGWCAEKVRRRSIQLSICLLREWGIGQIQPSGHPHHVECDSIREVLNPLPIYEAERWSFLRSIVFSRPLQNQHTSPQVPRAHRACIPSHVNHLRRLIRLSNSKRSICLPSKKRY